MLVLICFVCFVYLFVILFGYDYKDVFLSVKVIEDIIYNYFYYYDN